MESSTPTNKNSKSLRRRTLLRMADTPIPTEGVNDESERSSRRSFIEMQKKIGSPQQQSPALNDSVRFSGEQEIKDHFQICTKLHAENKITARVAWQLHIIDLLRVVSKKQRPDTLQVASTSLDIGAKVYGLRVDDIHAAGLKLANSMARFGQKDSGPDKENDDNAEDKDENAEAEAGSKQRKKRKLRYAGGPKNTIAKDPKSLQAPVPKLESVFFSTRIDSNMSTVENLFTNRLPMDKSCYKFMVLSKENAWPTGLDEAVQSLEEKREFDIDQLPKGGHICVAFQNFVLDKWDPDAEDQQNAERSISQPKNDVVVYDDEGHPVPELDGSVHDIFNDHNDDNVADGDEPQEEDFIIQQMQHQIAHVVDLMRPEEDFRRSEYSYNTVISMTNGKVIDHIWAGPSHWKLKFLRRSRSRFSGTVEAQQAQKQRKRMRNVESQPVLLTVDDDCETLLDNMKRIKLKKRINTSRSGNEFTDYGFYGMLEREELPHSQSTHLFIMKRSNLPVSTVSPPEMLNLRLTLLTRNLRSKVTLPVPDSSCINLRKHVHELMIKPGTIPIAKKEVPGAINDAQEEYENDAQIGTDNLDDMDDDHMTQADHDHGDDYLNEEEEIAVNHQHFMGDNLVDAPEYVPKAYVPYALQAKKMDMKKLKSHIWQLLADSSLEDVGNVVPTTFSKMFDQLPSILPHTMKKELSCSLAFSALLHICNEKNLKLTQFPSYQDFKIEGG